MTIQRAVVKATIFGTVQARSMFTADVVEVGGDTASLLWGVYLDALFTDVMPLVSPGYVGFSTEFQTYSAGSWITWAEEANAYAGAGTGDPLPNAVAAVLIGKATGLRKMGRKFFSPITETNSNGSALLPAVALVLGTVLVDYVSPVTGIGGGTLTPGIVNKTGTFSPFVGGVVSSLLGSIRRRKPGLGI